MGWMQKACWCASSPSCSGSQQETAWASIDFSIAMDDQLNLQAELCGLAIANLDKEIKAVTYHNLADRDAPPRDWRVNIVFDV